MSKRIPHINLSRYTFTGIISDKNGMTLSRVVLGPIIPIKWQWLESTSNNKRNILVESKVKVKTPCIKKNNTDS